MMALVLAMRSGHDFFVNGRRAVISWVDSPYRFGVKRDDGVVVTVTDEGWGEVYPGVKLQAGVPSNPQAKVVRVVFDAKGVKVLRGDIYRKTKVKASGPCGTCHGSGVINTRGVCVGCGGFGCSKCSKGLVFITLKCPDCEG